MSKKTVAVISIVSVLSAIVAVLTVIICNRKLNESCKCYCEDPNDYDDFEYDDKDLEDGEEELL